MTAYLFGQDFTLNFYPLKDNEPLSDADFATVSMEDSYLFTDSNYPDRDAAQSGTNALVTLSSGTWADNGSNGYSYAVTAIDDPDIDSYQYKRTYWLGANFRLDSGEQIQTQIEPIIMMRASAELEKITIVAADLITRFPTLDSYIATADLNNMIADAVDEIKDDLLAADVNYSGIVNPQKLERAVVYKALILAFDENMREPTDKWGDRLQRYQKKYERVLAQIPIAVDSDEDGSIDQVDIVAQPTSVIITR